MTQPLWKKYQPRSIKNFVGLESVKEILSKFAAKPFEKAWLFRGPTGTGKTTMGLALANDIRAQVHHTFARACTTLESVERVCRECWHPPCLPEDWKPVPFHLCLIDEANEMSPAVQSAFLTKLDCTAPPPQTVFVFTANATDKLKAAFLSRCHTLDFTCDGIAKELPELLARIWAIECSNQTCNPDFAKIVHDAQGDLRAALGLLEVEIICASRRTRIAEIGPGSNGKARGRDGDEKSAPSDSPSQRIEMKRGNGTGRELQTSDGTRANRSRLTGEPHRTVTEAPGIIEITKAAQPLARAERIRNLVNATRCLIIEVGRELVAAKAEMPHGEWLPWLEREFGWSEPTATRYMRIAKAFEPFKSCRLQDLEGISITGEALYLLSAPTVSTKAREEAVDQAEKGKRITLKEAKQMIADHDRQMAERAAAEVAEERKKADEEASRRIAEATERLAADAAKSQARADELQDEINRIKSSRMQATSEHAEDLFKKLTGTKTLTQQQLTYIAIALGKPIPTEIAQEMVAQVGLPNGKKKTQLWQSLPVALKLVLHTNLTPQQYLDSLPGENSGGGRWMDKVVGDLWSQAWPWLETFNLLWSKHRNSSKSSAGETKSSG